MQELKSNWVKNYGRFNIGIVYFSFKKYDDSRMDSTYENDYSAKVNILRSNRMFYFDF